MCYRTVPLGYQPLALTCWKDSIAAGLESGKIITLTRITGSQTAVLSEHTKAVSSLTFSPDGSFLVSGSSDNTIKLWDIQTGGVAKTFYGHTYHVLSVSISANCTTIASGSKDRTIRLWDIQTEECYCIIEQLDWVESLRFSPKDPQHLISVSDYKVQHWDTNGCQINSPHNGSHIAFSLDGTQIVSCQQKDILVQDSNYGT